MSARILTSRYLVAATASAFVFGAVLTGGDGVHATTPSEPSSSSSTTQGSYNGLAVTPPMGWSQCNLNCGTPTESQFVQQAKALVSTGLAKHGYDYVLLDDGWMAGERDSDGNLQADPVRFPHGMKWLADYVHSLGLKFGIYEDAGTLTCGRYPGSYGHYTQDAKQFAAWGADFLKFDDCYAAEDDHKAIQEMSNALLASGRNIVFDQSIPAYHVGGADYEDTLSWAGSVSNAWRSTPDQGPTFASFVGNYRLDVQAYPYSHPGAWNDLEYLDTGLFGDWTDAQYQAQMSVFAELDAPLIMSLDITKLSADQLKMLTNKEVIGVNQDRLGVQGRIVSQQGPVDVITKPLADGDRAVVFFNTSPSAGQVASISATKIGLPVAPRYAVRNLWTHDTTESAGNIGTYLAPYSAVMYRVHPGGSVKNPSSVTLSPTSNPIFEAGKADSVSASFTNDGSEPVSNVNLALTGPANTWNIEAATRPAFSTVQPGESVSATWHVTPPTSGTVGASLVDFGLSATYGSGDSTVTLGMPLRFTLVVLPSPVDNLTDAFNTVAITDDGNTAPGEIAGSLSYSAQALAGAGLTPGATVTAGGIDFTWPDVSPGTPDSVSGSALVPVEGTGTKLGVLSAAYEGASADTYVIVYADGSLGTVTVEYPNWGCASAGTTGAQSVAATSYVNQANGPRITGCTWNIWFQSIPLQAGKQAAYVLLPADPYLLTFAVKAGA